MQNAKRKQGRQDWRWRYNHTGKGKSEINDKNLEKDNTGNCEDICICTHVSLIQIFKNEVLIKYLLEYSSESM